MFCNIEKYSPLLFDSDQTFKKSELTQVSKDKVVEKLDKDSDLTIHLNSSVDRILLLHRNTKLFLFIMTGPFLIIFQTVKYIIKYGTLYLLYRKGK